MPRYTPTYEDWESNYEEPEKKDEAKDSSNQPDGNKTDDPQDTDTYSDPIDTEPEHKDK